MLCIALRAGVGRRPALQAGIGAGNEAEPADVYKSVNVYREANNLLAWAKRSRLGEAWQPTVLLCEVKPSLRSTSLNT